MPDSRNRFRPDIVAGLTAAAVVLPKAMAYASVAGLPVSVGLYTAFVPLIIYALLGTSRVLNVTSTSTLAILVATQLAVAVPDGDPGTLIAATATLTILTGVLLVAAFLLRLGFVANFISLPVLTGFKAGIGLVIILDQVPKLFGLHIEKQGFFLDIIAILRHLSETHPVTLIVALAAMLALIVAERLKPHSPAPLVVVALSIAICWLFGLPDRGVAVVGHIPRGLPALTLPDPELVMALLPGAIGIALMSFTETIAAGRAFADKTDPPIRPGRELLATGVANIGGGFFGAMPGGGGTSQTGVVRAVGGRTQVASLVCAAAALATMLALAGPLGLLPKAVLAAIVIVYSVGLIEPAEFRSIRHVRSLEFVWAVAAFLGVLIFGTLQGIVVAVVLSFLGLSRQDTYPRVHILGRRRDTGLIGPVIPGGPELETFDGLLIVRPEGRLFFGNAQGVGDRVRDLAAAQSPGTVLLDLSRVFDIEYSATKMLMDGAESVVADGVTIWISGMNPDVEACMRAYGFSGTLAEENVFVNVRTALDHYLERTTTDDVTGVP